MVVVFKSAQIKALRMTMQVFIVALILYPFAAGMNAKTEEIITKNLPLEFESTFPGNHKWFKPVNILDGDDSTWSMPSEPDYSDSDCSYYNLYLKRPVTNSGSLVDPTDYGRILKVQIKLTYSLKEGYKLSRYSYLEFEGLTKRLENTEIKGAGLNEQIVEFIDVTQAVKNWTFNDPKLWDEIVLRFGSEDDSLSERALRLYGLTLIVTYVAR